MFVIFYNNKFLVILYDLPVGTPMPHEILDWYAKHYGFERNKITGGYTDSKISCASMKYEDFFL